MMVRRIEIVSFPGVQLLDIAGPLEVFTCANDIEEMAGRKIPYEPVIVGFDREVKTSSGLALTVAPPSPGETGFDTLVVPGGWGAEEASKDEQLIQWIKQHSARARRISSVCSGAFLLAEAGLLDGRRAATYWLVSEEFKRRFPNVRLDVDPIFVCDGNLWTSAGVTAGIDMTLAMVEEDLGHDVAVAVAKRLVVFMKRVGGQSQFSAVLSLQDKGNRFNKLHQWMLENLQNTISLTDLAERAGMSVRSFLRHYREETGRTPGQALEAIRLENAQHLLEQGLSVNRVMIRCGFGSDESMRRAFRRRFGVSAQAYRERFGPKQAPNN